MPTLCHPQNCSACASNQPSRQRRETPTVPPDPSPTAFGHSVEERRAWSIAATSGEPAQGTASVLMNTELINKNNRSKNNWAGGLCARTGISLPGLCRSLLSPAFWLSSAFRAESWAIGLTTICLAGLISNAVICPGNLVGARQHRPSSAPARLQLRQQSHRHHEATGSTQASSRAPRLAAGSSHLTW